MSDWKLRSASIGEAVGDSTIVLGVRLDAYVIKDGREGGGDERDPLEPE